MIKLFKELSREDFKELMAAMHSLLGWVYLFVLLFAPIAEDNQRFADVGLGIVGTIIFGKILSDYFGNNGVNVKDKSVDA